MKKQITIVGISHRTGKSRNTGNEFDFYQLHGIYKDEVTDGQATCCMTLPDHELANCVVGETVTIFTHYYNGKEVLDAILR